MKMIDSIMRVNLLDKRTKKKKEKRRRLRDEKVVKRETREKMFETRNRKMN